MHTPLGDEGTATGRVLVVEDEDVVRTLLASVIRREGCICDEARDGEEGMRLAADLRPDVVVLDVRMPGIDGIEVLRRLKLDPRTIDIPTILLSASADADLRTAAFVRGAAQFVSKPVDSRELVARLRALLAQADARKAAAAARSELEGELVARTDEARIARLDALQSLARAAELRDDVTGRHLVRMSHYSRLIAIECGLDAAHAELVRQSSPMHDIGKIGIPDRILLKRGPLDADEWAVMREHPLIGYAILRSEHGSDMMAMAADIAVAHHERWDGSGYPYGLAGAAIPIEARIVAVADAFDALTNVRPYKPAWSVDAAVTEIVTRAGSHYDPAAVQAFIKALPAVVPLMRRYGDVPAAVRPRPQPEETGA